MIAKDFCYWLQGVYEIMDVKSFNETQTKKIKEELENVFIRNPRGSYPFCNWLKGFFDLENPKELNEKQTDAIRQKLDSIFQHVVELADTNNSTKKLNENEKYRC